MKRIIERHTLRWVKKQFQNLNTNNKLDIEDKTSIIKNLLLGIPGMILTEENCNNGELKILNGGDIISSIIQFAHNDLPIDGKYLSDFPDNILDNFWEQELILVIFRNLNDEERKNILSTFKEEKVDNNKSVKNTEISELDRELELYMQHEFFNKINISNPEMDILIKCMMVNLDGSPCDLSGKKIKEFKENLNEIPQSIKECLDYLNYSFTEKTTYLKNAHLPIIFICADLCRNKNVTPEKFKEITDNFFEIENKKYKEASNSHTTARKNVNIRIEIMRKYVEKNI